ncbi:tetratricopeptide repeat protein [Streptomyces sp. NPDC048288]|uniref:tetratricopeptide repeat protein n=1 Tax=Streptomyces sp. NPDC048288 TaxID=3365529 RepID=UPI0037145385
MRAREGEDRTPDSHGDGDADGDPDPGRGDDHIDFRRGVFRGQVVGKMIVNHGPRRPERSERSGRPERPELPGRPGPCTLPMAQPGFTGRAAELAALEARLCPPADPAPDTPVVCVVTGLGGMGKTALALKAAHRARKEGWFTGGALFLDLAGYDDHPVTPTRAVTSLLHALGDGDVRLGSEPVGHFGEEVHQLDAYRSRLAALADAGRRVLLVLDNVSDSAQVSPLLPASGLHCVLITTRECHESLTAVELPLGPLSPDDSVRLIAPAVRRRTAAADGWTPEETEAVRELTRLCGRMPLALRIATALLHRRRVGDPLPSLVGELRAAADPTRVLTSRGVDEYGRVLELAPVFDMSFRRLPRDRARSLCALAQVPFADFSTETAVVATGRPRSEALELLDDLVGAHLITGEEPGDGFPGRWRIHDLVRGYASALAVEDPTLVEEGGRARRRIRDHYRTKTEAACRRLRAAPPANPQPGPPTDPLPSSLSGALSAPSSGPSPAPSSDPLSDPSSGPSSDSPSDPSSDSSFGSSSGPLSDFSFASSSGAVPDPSPDPSFDSSSDLSSDSSSGPLSDFSSGPFEERAEAVAWLDAERVNLVAATQWPDELDPDCTVALALHLAEFLRERRFFEDWVAVGRAARERARKSPDRYAEAAVCNHLGNALLRADRSEEAVEPLVHAADLFHALGDATGEGIAWNNLGLAQRRSGLLHESAATHRRARDRFRDTGDVSHEGRAWHNLGLVLDTLGRYDEAAATLRRACVLHHATGNRFLHGDSLNSLGCVLHAAGRTDLAVAALRECLRIRRDDDNWHATSLTWNNLARVLDGTGRTAEAAHARSRADEAAARAGTTTASYGHHH